MLWWLCLFVVFNNIVFSDAIINGQPAIGAHKYHVAIQYKDNSYGCNGAIINERFVISAANCFTDEHHQFVEGPIKVIAGTDQLNKLDGRRRVEVDVDKVYVPVHYGTRGKYEDDIAIARLRQSLELKKNDLEALIIPVATSKFVDASARVTGFGWKKVIVTVTRDGSVSKTGEEGELLRYADTKILSNKECKTREYNSLKASQLCAKIVVEEESHPHGTCDTDRGSPLIDNSKVLIGILVANTPVCSEIYFPALYTRATSYSFFIMNSLRDHPSERIKTKDY